MIIGIYFVIGICFSIYSAFWGKVCFGSEAYCFGRHIAYGLTWPFQLFPSLGKIVGGIILLIIIGALVGKK